MITTIQEAQDLARQLEILQTDVNEKLWAQYTTGFDFGVEAAQTRVRSEFENRKSFELLLGLKTAQLSQIDRRRVEVLLRDFEPYHRSEKANGIRKRTDSLETKLGNLLNKFRAQIDGREVSGTEVSRILSESPDRELRRRAWASRTKVNSLLVKDGFVDLIHLRRELATECGEPDFVTMSLKQDDLSPGLFQGWSDLCREFRDAYRRRLDELAQKHLHQETCEPWDVAFLKSKVCPRNRQRVSMLDFKDALSRVFRRFGFETDGLPITYDIFPRANKSEWGYMFPIRVGHDTRVLANMDDRFASYWTLLHETAHAVHFLSLKPEERLLNRGLSSVVAEGFANFFGDLSYSRPFVEIFFPEDTDAALESFADLSALESLTSFELVVRALFDHELYRDDLSGLNDINDLRTRFDRDLLGLDVDGEPNWGHVIHHTVAPIYLHTYFLGDILGSALKDEFLRRHGVPWSSNTKSFGALWRDEILAPSGLWPLEDLCQRVTGQPLNVRAFLQQITSAEQT